MGGNASLSPARSFSLSGAKRGCLTPGGTEALSACGLSSGLGDTPLGDGRQLGLVGSFSAPSGNQPSVRGRLVSVLPFHKAAAQATSAEGQPRGAQVPCGGGLSLLWRMTGSWGLASTSPKQTSTEGHSGALALGQLRKGPPVLGTAGALEWGGGVRRAGRWRSAVVAPHLLLPQSLPGQQQQWRQAGCPEPEFVVCPTVTKAPSAEKPSGVGQPATAYLNCQDPRGPWP